MTKLEELETTLAQKHLEVHVDYQQNLFILVISIHTVSL